MENAELVALIKEKFSKGERREDISAELQNDGWDVGDIDLAITHIQHEALKQIPVVSWIIKKFEILEAKTANASPKLTIAVILGSIGVVIALAFILFTVFDPVGVKATERDGKRETDFIKLRLAIERYYGEKMQYPESLDVLGPSYIPSLPLDPKTGSPYQYRRTESGDYELCVSFETKNITCASSGTDQEGSIPQVDPAQVKSE